MRYQIDSSVFVLIDKAGIFGFESSLDGVRWLFWKLIGKNFAMCWCDKEKFLIGFAELPWDFLFLTTKIILNDENTDKKRKEEKRKAIFSKPKQKAF